jgi:hypothetical protein
MLAANPNADPATDTAGDTDMGLLAELLVAIEAVAALFNRLLAIASDPAIDSE